MRVPTPGFNSYLYLIQIKFPKCPQGGYVPTSFLHRGKWKALRQMLTDNGSDARGFSSPRLPVWVAGILLEKALQKWACDSWICE